MSTITCSVKCVCCVKGDELTAYDVARAKRHVECVDILQQHGAGSAADCRDVKVRREVEQVVKRARDAAAREAEYWIRDERELHRHAADVVSTTLSHATALLSRLHNDDDDDDDDDDEKRPSTKV